MTISLNFKCVAEWNLNFTETRGSLPQLSANLDSASWVCKQSTLDIAKINTAAPGMIKVFIGKTMKPKQNGHHFENVFKYIIMNEFLHLDWFFLSKWMND